LTVFAIVPTSILLGGAAALLLVPDRFGGALLAAAGLAVGLPVAMIGFIIGDLVGTPTALLVYLVSGGVGPWYIGSASSSAASRAAWAARCSRSARGTRSTASPRRSTSRSSDQRL
jgi:hypothetical protein